MSAKKPPSKICVLCGTGYHTPASRPRLTCSPVCAKALRSVNSGRPKEGTHRKCEVCGEEFYKPPSHVAKWPVRTCSRRCAGILKRVGDYKACKECGKQFYPQPHQARNGWGLYCSRACWCEMKARYRALYGRNVFTPEERKAWRGDHCVRCGSTEQLELDHIIPRFRGGLPIRENSQTLCRPCNQHKYWKEDLPAYEDSVSEQSRIQRSGSAGT